MSRPLLLLLLTLAACGPATAPGSGSSGSGSGPAPPPPPSEYATPQATYATAKAALESGDLQAFLRCWTPAHQRRLAMTVALAPAMAVMAERKKGHEPSELALEFDQICLRCNVALPDLWGLGDIERVADEALARADVPAFFAAVVDLIGRQKRGRGELPPRAIFARSYVGTLGLVTIEGDAASAPLVPREGSDTTLHFTRAEHGGWLLRIP